MGRDRVEPLLIAAIVAHSLAVGLALLFLTRWGLGLGGFSEVDELFFPRQAGAFHVVVAAAYALEYLRSRSVTVLLMTKSIAVVFLFGTWALVDVPWVVPVSGLGDAAMALAVLAVRRMDPGR